MTNPRTSARANSTPVRAVDQLDTAVDLVRTVCRVEAWNDDPTHGDFYRYGGLLTQLVMTLADLAGKLARQVDAYGDRHRLRDDEGDDPDQRIGLAVVYLGEFAAALNGAVADVAAYHSAIGHIGVIEPERGPR